MAKKKVFYATTYTSIAGIGVDFEIEDCAPTPPEDHREVDAGEEDWELVGSAANQTHLFWFWKLEK